ncbi:MAG: hypothetical protein EA396_02220 [Anaerolineaceae bacterium]|nr:MAG: hypothetical protein EA396_02220 [Anaerolineaceae bacterium]
MQPEHLLKGLAHKNPVARRIAAHTIGTLDEVALLPQMARAFKSEADSDVKAAIRWAGERLKAASSAGYSTMDALFNYFGMNRAIENMPTEKELRLLQQLDANNISMADLINQRHRSMTDLIYQRPEQPTQADIQRPLNALRADDRTARSQAMARLFELKNMAALPHLVNIFLHDPDPTLREQAQNTAKYLYWHAISWRMHQDGSIIAALEARARALGKLDADDGDTPQAPAVKSPDESSAAEAAEILRRAQEARAKRRKR